MARRGALLTDWWTLLLQVFRAEARAIKFAARADATIQEEGLRSVGCVLELGEGEIMASLCVFISQGLRQIDPCRLDAKQTYEALQVVRGL